VSAVNGVIVIMMMMMINVSNIANNVRLAVIMLYVIQGYLPVFSRLN